MNEKLEKDMLNVLHSVDIGVSSTSNVSFKLSGEYNSECCFFSDT